jgi:catechol 2,3-dioxygenase-like lactoylglutathione lyase family enzyme
VAKCCVLRGETLRRARFRDDHREVEMSATKETKEFDTVDHIAVAVSDVKGTVDWYLKNFSCKVAYQDETWALLEFANIRVAFVLPNQHPPHFALLRDPAAYGEPKTHRDGTRSVYLNDPSGNSIEVLALK